MDADHALAGFETERAGDGGVEYLGDLLALKGGIARTDVSHLIARASLSALLALTRAGSIRDRGGVSIGGAAAFLNAFKIARPTVALLKSPPGTARQHGGHAGLLA